MGWACTGLVQTLSDSALHIETGIHRSRRRRGDGLGIVQFREEFDGFAELIIATALL